jgi:CubicO group peptidase (beta-lactamase class C family)
MTLVHSLLRSAAVRRTPAVLLMVVSALLASCADDGADGRGSASLLESDGTATRYSRAVLRADADEVQRSADIVDVVAMVRLDDAVLQARAGAYERAERDPKPLWDAQFRIASASKVFTAVVVLQLVAEGVLALDDSVDTWLPGVVSGQGNDGRQITLRQLLSHTSGLFDYVADETLGAQIGSAEAFAQHRFDAVTQEQWLAAALQHPPVFPPGTRFFYSGTNYVLLGLIIEAASGRDFRAQIEHRIIAKLGLTRTYVPGYDPYLVGPHLHGFARFLQSDELLDVSDTSLRNGADTAVVSTLSDLTSFFRALMRGQLLDAPTLALMQETLATDDVAFPGGRYGLGLQWSPLSCGGGYFHHAGDTLGYSVRTGVTPDGARSAAVVLNSPIDPAATGPAAAKLIDRALCASLDD